MTSSATSSNTDKVYCQTCEHLHPSADVLRVNGTPMCRWCIALLRVVDKHLG